jgi:hypothetical protein
VAERLAPVLHIPWARQSERRAWDLPAAVDFDGNLDASDNMESLLSGEHPIVPTVYWTVLETDTHVFATYHFFHPLDWSPYVSRSVRVSAWHENDGENLQVVVDRASGDVVLLFTQAHYCGGVYAPAPPAGGELPSHARWAPGSDPIRGPLLLVDDEGRPDPRGRHAAVFVQDQGHGIYGVTDLHSEVVVRPDGSATFAGNGLVLRPAAPGEAVAEPPLERLPGGGSRVVPYQLESTTAKLWPGLRDGSLLGRGGLFDGALRYQGPRIDIGVPRYYEGDRFSGPFGPDRGIAPFAVDFRFGQGEVGALFFDPARRYAECLTVPRPWSLEYEDYPFGGT